MTKKKKQQPALLDDKNYIRQRSRNLPLHECLITENWQKSGIANILVAKAHTNGNITLCIYLVDLFCLGIKDTMYRFNISLEEYLEFVDDMQAHQDFIPCTYELAHNIIYSALQYAEDLGFEPHKDFLSITRFMLEEDTDDVEFIEIECGHNGKPHYFQGPNDNPFKVNTTLRQLEKAVGKDNFYFTSQLDIKDEDDDDWDEDEDDDWDEDEDDDWDEDDEIEEEISNMDYEDKISLFNELSEIESLSDAEVSKLFIVTGHLFFEKLCDENEVDAILNKWKKETNGVEISDAYYAQLLGLPENTELSEDQLTLIKLIAMRDEEALEKVKTLWPESPFYDFLDVMSHKDTKKAKSVFKKLYKNTQYPQYPLFKYLSDFFELSKTRINCYADMFGQRKGVTSIEIFHFLSLQTINFAQDEDFNALYAISDFAFDLLNPENDDDDENDDQFENENKLIFISQVQVLAYQSQLLLLKKHFSETKKPIYRIHPKK